MAGFSQTPVIGIGEIGITGLPEVVYVNQTISFRVNIQNKGVVNIIDSVNGAINIFAATIQGQQIQYIGAQSVIIDTLFSGDTLSVDLTFPVDTSIAPLSMGGNTVVVWPAAFGVLTSDSVFQTFTIILPPDTIGFNSNLPTSFPDTAEYGTTDSMIFYIENKRTSTYSGTIELHHLVISDSTGALVTQVDTNTLNNITLASLESRRVAMPQDFENPQYRMGGNTVVVWPANDDMVTADSISGRVTVVIINAIDGPKWEGSESIKLFPNPTQNFLQIEFESSLIIQSVLVTNELGQTILETKQTHFDVSNFLKGVYFITVDFGEEKQRTYKFLKQ